MWNRLQALLQEPAPERPTSHSIWDHVLATLFALTVVAEAVLRPGLTVRPQRAVAGLALAAAVWFRRTHPFRATAAAFVMAIVLSVAELPHAPSLELYSNACILLLPYWLLRLGAWREVAIGALLILGAYVTGMMRAASRTPQDLIGAAAVLSLPALLGVSARFRARAQQREFDHVRLRERALLARDLHDTVAHHVTAIAIQAQAAQAVLSIRPDAAAGALATIEQEATHTLDELRTIVRALRDEAKPSLEPQKLIADIATLGRSHTPPPTIDATIDGDPQDCRESLQAAVYRIAQESITNALRHARNATKITVHVTIEPTVVRLRIDDDGTGTSPRRGGGFGIAGMMERAALLRGTVHAGPRSVGSGWTVEAQLPRTEHA